VLRLLLVDVPVRLARLAGPETHQQWGSILAIWCKYLCPSKAAISIGPESPSMKKNTNV
jgi:hypothetical protein